MKRIIPILCILICYKACTPVSDEPKIQIYVAASLSPVITELVELFESVQTIQVTVNTASSGTLARQIEQGATADLFISANQQWLSFLQKEELILSESTLPVKNQLVLIAPNNGTAGQIDLSVSGPINELLRSKRIAIGDPNHVPVGQYAMEAMESLNWQFSPQKTLLTNDARATLVAVALGEADLGIVYQTDAEKSEKVNTIGTIPEDAYAAIRYFAGTCSNNPLTADFLSFLNSPEAKQVWEKHGFIL